MIELNYKTRQDFLDREWVQRLLDAGVDMNDAKYVIVHNKAIDRDEISFGSPGDSFSHLYENVVPTYTLSELLYKLNEYPFIFEMEEACAPLSFCKDAPFYGWYYAFKDKNGNSVCTLESFFEHPIESAAGLLLQCIKNKIPYVKDISDKK